MLSRLTLQNKRIDRLEERCRILEKQARKQEKSHDRLRHRVEKLYEKLEKQTIQTSYKFSSVKTSLILNTTNHTCVPDTGCKLEIYELLVWKASLPHR